MKAAVHSEPEALCRSFDDVAAQVRRDVWVDPEHPLLLTLAAALKTYYLKTQRMHPLTAPAAECRRTVEGARRLEPELKSALLESLDRLVSLPADRIVGAIDHLQVLTTAAAAADELADDAEYRVRMESKRAIEDAFLRWGDYLAGRESAPMSLPSSGGSSMRSGPMSKGSSGASSAMPLSVAGVKDFLSSRSLPESVFAPFGQWLVRNPDDVLPDSWIRPGSCPFCGADVMVAFKGAPGETAFCRDGHVLKSATPEPAKPPGAAPAVEPVPEPEAPAAAPASVMYFRGRPINVPKR